MLIEGLSALAALLIGGVFLRKLRSEKFLLRLEFIDSSQSRIPFVTKEYKNFDDADWDEEQLAHIALDLEKNRFFRDIGITGFSLVEPQTGREFFYIRLKKDP
jgi:hypothetical protein